MARKKREESTSTAVATGEVESTEEVEVVETKTEVAVEESTAKKQFRAYMDSYKLSNPVKYALKEKELLKQLNSL
jgi:hypothetical protein